MQKVSFKKLSLLGLVLMCASAISAAILPSNNKSATFDDKRGEITASGDGDNTCKTLDTNDQQNCNDTDSQGANSSTSVAANGGTSGDQPLSGGDTNTTLGD